MKPGGVFLINCQWDGGAGPSPARRSKRYIAQNNIQLYTINAIDLAIEIGMGKRTNTILQSAFFTLAKVMPRGGGHRVHEGAATKSYGKKGQDIVDMNYKAIDAGATAFVKIDVPAEWANAVDKPSTSLEGKPDLVKMVKDILEPVDKMDGDSLPVSAFGIMWTAVRAGRLRLREARRGRVRSRLGRRSASSATSAPMSAPTPPSVPSR